MTTAVETYTLDEADVLRERIAGDLAKKLSGHKDDALRVYRAEVQLEGISALDWLAAQAPGSRGYWSDREGGFELAGIGRADVITGEGVVDYEHLFGLLDDRINAADGAIRYFGGFKFDPFSDRERIWEPFKTYRFILPRFELVCRDGACTFACNATSHEDSGVVEDELARLTVPDSAPGLEMPALLERTDAPGEVAWEALVQDVLGRIGAGTYEKIVLARRTQLRFDETVNAARLLSRLKGATGQRFHFCFQPVAHTAFLGASPERLYRREHDQILTEAIAGTRPRGTSEAESRALSEELLQDEKERREQQLVVDAMATALKALCHEVEWEPEPSLLELEHGFHLITRFEGRLNEHMRDADVLGLLHPTPAVGGYPVAEALQDIVRLEPFDRGWYAGPVGWISKDRAQFAVGIRSALVENARVHLFSGAGIVNGSTPANEWAEIENKISDFLAVLTGT